MIRVA